MTRLKPDRPVNPDGRGNVPLSSASVSEGGTEVHLKGYGSVRVFGIVGRKGDTGYRATNSLGTDDLKRLQLSDFSRTTEEYHRGLGQFCGTLPVQIGKKSEKSYRSVRKDFYEI